MVSLINWQCKGRLWGGLQQRRCPEEGTFPCVPEAELRGGFLQRHHRCSAAGSRTHMCCQLLQCPGDRDCAQGWAGQSFRFQRAAVRWKFQFAFKRGVPSPRGCVKTVIWVYPKASESKRTAFKLQAEMHIFVWVLLLLFCVLFCVGFFCFVLN